MTHFCWFQFGSKSIPIINKKNKLNDLKILLNIDTIKSAVIFCNKKIDVEKVLLKLQNEFKERGINLVCISNKWSFRTAQNLSKLMSQEKTVEKKLSKAAIETLAIIVYHQPVTRAEIEEIRGVAF